MSENHAGPAASPTLSTVDGTTIVVLHGEIDLATALPLAARLNALTSVELADLVLDLRCVSFIDCAGLGVLCRTRNRIQARGGRLRLVTGSLRFLRVLGLTGLAGAFEVHPQWPSASASRPSPSPSPPSVRRTYSRAP